MKKKSSYRKNRKSNNLRHRDQYEDFFDEDEEEFTTRDRRDVGKRMHRKITPKDESWEN